jgi:predicted porin
MQITSNDPFGTNGVGDTKQYAIAGVTTTNAPQTIVRASNALEYLTPPGIGGVYAHLMYAFGEQPSNSPTNEQGDVYGGRLGFAGGPVDVSVAYNHTELVQTATSGSLTDYGAAFTLTFGAFKPMFSWVNHRLEFAGSTPERTDFQAGIVMTFGATDIRASYNLYNVKNTDNDAQQIALGAVYNLSRRTAFYGTVAQMDNKGSGTAFVTGDRPTITPGGKTTGAEIGLRHSF